MGNLLTKRRTTGEKSLAYRGKSGQKYPVLPFLVFWDFLVFFPFEDFLVFLTVFLFFSRDFRGSVAIKIPCFFFGGFPCPFPKKKKERKDRVQILLFFCLRVRGGQVPSNIIWGCSGSFP